MAFARHHFSLSQPQDDGTPLADHLQVVWENTGEIPAMLADAPAMPPGCSVLWADFLELHGSRGASFGPMRITFADFKAWQDVRETQLSAWEIDCIRKADDIWLSEFAPKPKADK